MRYVNIQLSELPAPQAIVPPAIEDIIAAVKAQIVAGIDDPATALLVQQTLAQENEALTKLCEAYAARELLHYQRENEAVEAVLLATSQGTDLDNFCADLGVRRMTITPADNTTTPPTPAVMENDASLRARRELAPNAFSTAGAYGAYQFEALSAHPQVADVAVYGPETGFVNPGHARVVVLSSQGDGTPSLDVINAVSQRLWQDQDTRPLTDFVEVLPASITPYYINVQLTILPGPDPSVIVSNAVAALTAYAAQARQIGRKVTLSAINACANADLVNVTGVVNVSPTADIDPGPQGATYCTNTVVTYQVATLGQ